jgi:hypothetical protein
MSPWNATYQLGALAAQDTGELQDGPRHVQHPGQEGDQDQPEGPVPAAQHANRQQRDEGSEGE